jgi:hypothetical protein
MFGSFFTESVQSLILREPWEDPILPSEVQKVRDDVLASELSCGTGARSNFLLDLNGFTFVNHGAFGATMRCVLQEVRCWQEHCEQQPLRFMDRYSLAHSAGIFQISTKLTSSCVASRNTPECQNKVDQPELN